MRPNGRIFFPWFLQGILQPHLNSGRGLRPLSFAANGTRAKEEMNDDDCEDVVFGLEHFAQDNLADYKGLV